MKIITKLFGEIELDTSKIITFESGIIGFEYTKQYLLIHDVENENANMAWLQSVEEPTLALPVIDPLCVKPDYNPVLEGELLSCLAPIEVNDEILAMTTITVPSDISKMTTNLKAPILINTSNLKGCQIIIDADYEVRFPIYDILKAASGKDGE